MPHQKNLYQEVTLQLRSDVEYFNIFNNVQKKKSKSIQIILFPVIVSFFFYYAVTEIIWVVICGTATGDISTLVSVTSWGKYKFSYPVGYFDEFSLYLFNINARKNGPTDLDLESWKEIQVTPKILARSSWILFTFS